MRFPIHLVRRPILMGCPPVVFYIDPHHVVMGESTRPDLSPEQEAEICGLDPDRISYLRYRLDQAHPGPEFERAWDDYVKATSVTLAEAAIMLGLQPVQMSHRARQGLIKAFQHRNRWRMWLADLREIKT